ncbi:MAG TPA: porin, partial [Elusimicrobiota bacterium]|nr:porin [Elusimicrobiota bacterium]
MKTTLHLAAIALLALARPARAQADDKRIQDLERKVGVLTEEIERLKLGESAEEPAPQAVPGLGSAASKVYQKASRKVSIGGYGELNYQNFSRRQQNADPSGRRATSDLARAVFYVGYKFNDWILFNSEIEFEHASSGEGAETRGEVEIEQAYLDFKLSEPLGIRVGHVIVPMGLVNEAHEPTAFHGVLRPNVENNIIPSTWHENGVGVFGRAGPVTYRSYILAGLTAVATTDPTADGFTAESALREGRTEGSNSFAEDKAWATRVDVAPIPGVVVGGSVYVGQAGQGQLQAHVPVSLWDVHGTAEYQGAELKALYA